VAEAVGTTGALQLEGIVKDFPGVRALDGVSLDLRPGEVHALCGENGAGKSTLIKVLCGYHPAGTYGGRILMQGREVAFRSLRAAEEHGIALIAQELALVPELTVAENIVLGREPRRGPFVDWTRARRVAVDALARVGLDVRPDQPVRELGVGQQQLVEIARALSKEARVLVLDEPTAALTETDAARLLRLVAELRTHGVSSIYISHRLEEVFRIADRITVLRDGRTVGTSAAADLTPDVVIARMVGREVKDLYPRPPAREGTRALALRGWSVGDELNPGRHVLHAVDLDVHEGEVLGIGGLMGAGRTALVSSLFGAARAPVTGRLQLGAQPERGPFRSPPEAIAAGLALVSEDRKRFGLVLEHSVGENLVLATLRRFRRGALLDGAAAEAACAEQVRTLRIKTAGLDTAVGLLSGGNQQKVVVGRWLLTRPRVLLLDEPTRGVDVGARAEIYEIIRKLAVDGLAVVLVSSDLPELLGMSHRVLVLNQGRATATLRAQDATPEAVMTAATTAVGVA
jgi:D-xylose transport system ATP-binding protein